MHMTSCYRFVTRQELDSLGMSHLVGSPLLRAYMHGFFVHNKLWQKARAIAAPLEYETVRKQQIQARLEAERAQRITIKRKLPKVCGSDSCAACQIRDPTGQAAKDSGIYAQLVGRGEELECCVSADAKATHLERTNHTFASCRVYRWSSMLIVQSCMHHDRVMADSSGIAEGLGCSNMAPHSCISLNCVTHTQLGLILTF